MDRDERTTELLTKGVSQIFPNIEFLQKKLSDNGPLSVYLGFDPTAPSLHLGHAIQLRKLRAFQDLGHKVILLMGDFTATIGDPDKLSTRAPLTRKQVLNNLKNYKKQASPYIRFSGKNAATIKFNARWLSKLKFADILELASCITVEQLLKRDMFQKRIEENRPLYLHEFMYPLMQGYDSVAMDVDGEIGGTDQMFNMLAGRTLMKQIKNKEKFVLTLKLLEDATGKKMGKTEGNAVSLTDSPREMYGKVMSWADSIIPVALELCTDMSMKEIDTFLTTTTHPKEQKMRLAFEIVRANSGEVDAKDAAAHFAALFERGETPTDALEVRALATTKETLLSSGVVSSAAELRRLILSGSISSTTTNEKLSVDSLDRPILKDTYRIGKHRFVRVI